MRTIRTVWLNEMLLMRLRKKTAFFILFSAVLPIILAVSYRSLQAKIGLFGITSSYPVILLSLYTVFLIPLFIIMTTADMFPSETAARTVKLTLLRPITRLQAFTGKMLAGATAIGVIVSVLYLVSIGCIYMMGDGQHVVIDDWLGYFKAYLAAFVVMIAFLLLFGWIAQWFQSPTSYMASALVLYAAAKILPFFSSAFSAFSLTAYSDWYVLWLRQSTDWGSLFNSSFFILSGLVLFFTMGYIMYDRKEA